MGHKNRICSRCIYDENVHGIFFSEKDGICNYCKQVDALIEEYGTGKPSGQAKLQKIIDQIKQDGINSKYDCVIGVSGGTDSSYLLYLAKLWGLRPIAVHYDNTWNSSIATMNIKKVLNKLDIDLHTYVVNNKEADDIFRSFLLAGVPEIDASTDLAIAHTLREVAKKYSTKYILEGHSFVTEGITPLGINYFDGRYIKSIHKRFGRMNMESYQLMTFSKFLISIVFHRPKFIRPFWYLNYTKEDAKILLKKEFNWEDYGGHHLENRMTAFCHSVYLPQKYGCDLRNNTIAARVRRGLISQEDGLKEYKNKPKADSELIAYIQKRLAVNSISYDKIMSSEPVYWENFPTYKSYFEVLKPVFFVMAKLNLVTMSFYLKYCFKKKNR